LWNNKHIFIIYEYEIQEFVEEHFKRQLTEEELYTAKKCLEFGLLTDIGTVYRAAVETAIESNKH
jgi:hypothetical protein